MSLRKAGCIAAALLLSATANADVTLIHAGELLTVPGERPLRNQTVVIENDRIVDVRSGFATADEFGSGDSQDMHAVGIPAVPFQFQRHLLLLSEDFLPDSADRRLVLRP